MPLSMDDPIGKPRPHVDEYFLSLALQAWTNKCIFDHDIPTLQKLGYGENLSLIGGPW